MDSSVFFLNVFLNVRLVGDVHGRSEETARLSKPGSLCLQRHVRERI